MKVKYYYEYVKQIDDLVQKMQLQFQSLSEDDKMAELQTLVMNQRKTINNLTKTNNELSQAVRKI